MFEDLYLYLYYLAPEGGLPMKWVGVFLGFVLVATHVRALRMPAETQTFLRAFPRSYPWGIILLTLSFLWSLLVIQHMDMGEFHYLRRWFLLILPAGFFGVVFLVREFLAVRALGCLMLLAAGPVLSSAFLQPQTSRLLLPILAYVWIIGGMFLVGMPYLMRDWVSWATAKPIRWKWLTISGIAYGAVLFLVALIDY